MANRVTHFEICADDPRRAVTFYRDAFGWNIQKWEGPGEYSAVQYWLVNTGDGEPGIHGAITPRPLPGASTVNIIAVASWEDAAAAIVQHGGQVLSEKMTVPGVGYTSHCRDSEGNIFGIMQYDTTVR